MALPTALVRSSQSEIDGFSIRQVVALCGDGKLSDSSLCSSQLREYFQIAKSENLERYLQACLEESFEASGFVLQDIVNEFGRRLDYGVQNGLYRGKKNEIGFDGLWTGTNGRQIIIEVKTTDVYNISLETIAQYRESLMIAGKIARESSILLVIGREETGSLEAQVRGSRFAWIIRIISPSALARLVALKEDSKPGTVERIHDVLVPFEYTKLDRLIDIAFAVVEDATAAFQEEQGQEPEGSSVEQSEETGKHDVTPSDVIEKFRNAMVEAMIGRLVPLVKKSRALYWSTDKETRIAVAVSKQYDEGDDKYSYWYGYHHDWDTFLGEAVNGFYVLEPVIKFA
ncbi:MAG TPA: hypothetical protein VHX60_14905 [Acidobacteriaceae bacterium]|jgi:hypothetical protein|nr:hypothetical protein [Acidobacteriaceae bacterium]